MSNNFHYGKLPNTKNPENPSFIRNTISCFLRISLVFVALYVEILVKDTELGKAKV
jgi:hypothetical protein